MNRKFIALTVTILVAAVGVTTAWATDALGTVSATLFARGTFTEPVRTSVFSLDGIYLATDSTTDHVVQTITFGADSTSGWHRHPGVVLVTVKSGTLTRYDSRCRSETVTAGQSFWESSGHDAGLVRNEGTDPVVVYVTYIIPTDAPLRINTANPGCSVH